MASVSHQVIDNTYPTIEFIDLTYLRSGYTFEASTNRNIVRALPGIDGPKRAEIINRQLCHYFRADIGLGLNAAQELGVGASSFLGSFIGANSILTQYFVLRKSRPRAGFFCSTAGT